MIRVAVPPSVDGLAGGSGHSNMWRQVLGGLRSRAEVEVRRRPPRSRFGSRPDVWLADGHSPPPDTGGAPLVVQVHEASWADPELAHFLHADFARAMAESTEAAVRAATAVITPSEAARVQVVAAYGLPPDTVHAVHHGVDLDVFRPRESVAAGAEPYLLYVGVLHPRKNIDAVRHAAASIGVDLVIVGQPPADRLDSQDLVAAALAPLAGLRVRRVEGPPDAKLAELYANAAAFCLPSFFEGFGLPALEAMACGAPVVVSDRGALPEFVTGGGVVTSPDPDSVTAAVHKAMADPGLRRAARARAEQMPWSRTAEGWLAVLDSCVR